jgi:acyl-CoA:acyl-CoA alkyltransferase
MHPRGDEWSYIQGDGARLRVAFLKVGPDIVFQALREAGTKLEDYKRVLVHQVTMPFIKGFTDLTGVRDEQLVITLSELGNIAAASIPFAWPPPRSAATSLLATGSCALVSQTASASG